MMYQGAARAAAWDVLRPFLLKAVEFRLYDARGVCLAIHAVRPIDRGTHVLINTQLTEGVTPSGCEGEVARGRLFAAHGESIADFTAAEMGMLDQRIALGQSVTFSEFTVNG